MSLDYSRVSDMFGGEPEESHEKPGEEFAKGHYEQLVSASGTIELGEQRWEIDGYGLRDHSWGPRYWQAPWYYRWLTANFGDDFGFMGSRIARRDSEGTRGGFVWDGTKLLPCHDFEISTEWEGDDPYHQRIDRGAARQGRRRARASGRSTARCSTSSRCATGATGWSPASPRA